MTARRIVRYAWSLAFFLSGVACSYLVICALTMGIERNTVSLDNFDVTPIAADRLLKLERQATRRPARQSITQSPLSMPFSTRSFQEGPFSELSSSFTLTDGCKSLLNLTGEEVKQVEAAFAQLHEETIACEASVAIVDKVSEEHYRVVVPQYGDRITAARVHHEKLMERVLGAARSSVLKAISSDVYFERFSEFGGRVRFLEAKKIRGNWRILHGFDDGNRFIVVRPGQSRIRHLSELLESHIQ